MDIPPIAKVPIDYAREILQDPSRKPELHKVASVVSRAMNAAIQWAWQCWLARQHSGKQEQVQTPDLTIALDHRAAPATDEAAAESPLTSDFERAILRLGQRLAAEIAASVKHGMTEVIRSQERSTGVPGHTKSGRLVTLRMAGLELGMSGPALLKFLNRYEVPPGAVVRMGKRRILVDIDKLKGHLSSPGSNLGRRKLS